MVCYLYQYNGMFGKNVRRCLDRTAGVIILSISGCYSEYMLFIKVIL